MRHTIQPDTTIEEQHCMIFYGPNMTAELPPVPDTIDWSDM